MKTKTKNIAVENVLDYFKNYRDTFWILHLKDVLLHSDFHCIISNYSTQEIVVHRRQWTRKGTKQIQKQTFM